MEMVEMGALMMVVVAVELREGRQTEMISSVDSFYTMTHSTARTILKMTYH